MRQYVATAMKTVSEAWEQPWHFCLSVKRRSMPATLGIAVSTVIFREAPADFTDHVIGGKMLGKASLTQYLGFQEENMALEPSIVEIGYQPGSSYLICSDGVTDMLSDQELQKILDGTETAEEKVGKILEQALERGGRDNVTLVLAQISGYEEKIFSNAGQNATVPDGNKPGE